MSLLAKARWVSSKSAVATWLLLVRLGNALLFKHLTRGAAEDTQRDGGKGKLPLAQAMHFIPPSSDRVDYVASISNLFKHMFGEIPSES